MDLFGLWIMRFLIVGTLAAAIYFGFKTTGKRTYAGPIFFFLSSGFLHMYNDYFYSYEYISLIIIALGLKAFGVVSWSKVNEKEAIDLLKEVSDAT